MLGGPAWAAGRGLLSRAGKGEPVETRAGYPEVGLPIVTVALQGSSGSSDPKVIPRSSVGEAEAGAARSEAPRPLQLTIGNVRDRNFNGDPAQEGLMSSHRISDPDILGGLTDRQAPPESHRISPGNDRQAVENLGKAINRLAKMSKYFRPRDSKVSRAIEALQLASYWTGLAYIHNYGLGEAPMAMAIAGLFGTADMIEASKIAGTRIGDFGIRRRTRKSVAERPAFNKWPAFLSDHLKSAGAILTVTRSEQNLWDAWPAEARDWFGAGTAVGYLRGIGGQYYVNLRNRWGGPDLDAKSGPMSRKASLRSQQVEGLSRLWLLVYAILERFGS
jgi:hypothetical protein